MSDKDLKKEGLEFAGTLEIWRNELILVLNKGKTPRLEEIGDKYYLEFEEHRTIKDIPSYENPVYLGYRINREEYPEKIRRIITFEGRYYYLTQNREGSNEKKLTFIPFGLNEDEKEWKKFYLPKGSKQVVLYVDEES